MSIFSSGSPLQKIYKTVREQIVLLKYPPGGMISENALASEFGVSRTPIRRVLQQLEFDGLVTTRQGVGTMTTTADLKSLKEVYMLRIKLAELIGELSPVPSRDGDITEFDALLERSQKMCKTPDIEELGHINLAVNDSLVRFIANRPLREISDRLYYQTARVWPQILPDMNLVEEAEIMRMEIEQLISALRDNDMEKVGLYRRDHIANSLSRIQQYLGGGNMP